jgi:peptidoglycan/xylan/chitin deacetylase (PgdA/CDA1 family)
VRAGHVLAWLIVAAQLAGCGARAAAPAFSTTPTVAPQRDSPPTVSHPQPLSVRPPVARPPSVGSPGETSPPRRVSPAIVEHGPRSRRWVALTFDADMTRAMLSELRTGRVHGWYDAALFAELRATRTPATIFLTGLWTERYPAVVRRLARDPRFELENHSLDHAGWVTPCYGLPTVSGVPSKRREIARASRIIERVAHVTPRYFRFPGGCASAADRHLVAGFGERPVGWDVVSGDAFQSDPAAIVRAVLSGVRPGSIVVAHCIGAPNTPATARAMAIVVPALRARGYRFVTLRRLLEQPRHAASAAAPTPLR